jgi:hypothetical protein
MMLCRGAEPGMVQALPLVGASVWLLIVTRTPALVTPVGQTSLLPPAAAVCLPPAPQAPTTPPEVLPPSPPVPQAVAAAALAGLPPPLVEGDAAWAAQLARQAAYRGYMEQVAAGLGGAGRGAVEAALVYQVGGGWGWGRGGGGVMNGGKGRQSVYGMWGSGWGRQESLLR